MDGSIGRVHMKSSFEIRFGPTLKDQCVRSVLFILFREHTSLEIIKWLFGSVKSNCAMLED